MITPALHKLKHNAGGKYYPYVEYYYTSEEYYFRRIYGMLIREVKKHE